uniref:Uncharacterized protein n=1 Tax=Arundo donax TaxID=35708 RepID=A0A0A8Z3D5_ARUDO
MLALDTINLVLYLEKL